MARLRNAYADPTPQIGEFLARAIFGDPQAAAAQRQEQAEAELRAAQARQANAHGSLYEAQAQGVTTANGAQQGLPDLARQWALAQQPAPPPSVSSQAFADFDNPLPTPAPRPDPINALGAVIGAMGQMQGDKIDPTQMMGALGAFAGDDELARRGMIAQGKTPGENFAINTQRADGISARDAGEDQTKAFGVANINRRSAFDVATVNNRDDLPVAEIRRHSAFDAAHINAQSRRDAAAAKVAGRAVAGKPPRLISKNATDALGEKIKEFEKTHHVTLGGKTRANVLSKAVTEFQQSGNMIDAINRATARLVVDGQRAIDRDSGGNGPPVAGARKAADGNWYVQTGRNRDGSPAYGRVSEPARNWQQPKVTNW